MIRIPEYSDGYNPTRILFTGDVSSDERPEDDESWMEQLDEILDQWEQEFIQKNGRRPTGDEYNSKYLELTGRKDETSPKMPDDPNLPF